jgi:phosphatidylserine decarboxylase
MEQIIILLSILVMTTGIFIFGVAKLGFNKKYLYTDNLMLALVTLLIVYTLYYTIAMPFWLLTPLISGFIVLALFVTLFFYRFFRNPKREIPGGKNDIVSGADGRIIYIKELEANQIPVSVKKLRIANISEITKTEILQQPCYLIGIAMTLWDVHMNRAPIDGKIILVKHTPGTAIGLNTPKSTIENERNTVVIEREDGLITGFVQIAARWVDRCIVSMKEGETVKRGQIIGKIRWGSQLDMIIPRNCHIMVREGEQVHAGSTIIAKYLEDEK